MDNEYIGYSGMGSFVQRGGSNTASTELAIGINAGSSGSYTLTDNGQLNAGWDYVGYSGSATFTQFSGTHTANSLLGIGMQAGANGTYTLSGGALSGQEWVGESGTGTFNQTGGTNTLGFTHLVIGDASGGSGSYSLSGGLLSAAYDEYLGNYGVGSFAQSGGTHALSADLFMARYAGSSALYTLSGSGILSTAVEYIGYYGTAVFTQAGGLNTTQYATLGGYTGSSGTYNLNGGTLSVRSVSGGPGAAAFNFNGGVLQFVSIYTETSSMPMTLGSGGAATFDTAGATVTFSGALSGPGSLAKVDSGTLILAAPNTYSGNTLISGGTLALGSPLALQNSTLDTSGGGTVSFGTLTAATLGGLTGPGTLTLANASSSAVALSVGNNGTSTTYAGTLQGSGSLNKIGSGTLNLAGSNTYTGATTVSQGKLLVDGWLTNSAVSVNSGGTLGGTGNLGSVTVSSSGSLSPGDSLGVLHLSGNLTLLAGAAMDYELDGFSTDDEISMPSGLLTLSGQQFSDFHFSWTNGFGPGTYTLVNAQSITGLGSNTSGTIDGLPATLVVQGSGNNQDLVLSVTPEPGTLVLLAVGTIGLVGYGLRRRATRRTAKPAAFDQPDVPAILSFPSHSSTASVARRAA